jgi:hypothetical protein
MTDTGSGMGMSGPIIPYAGKFGGFMPYRMGASSSLSFPSRSASAPGSNRTSFSLSPMSSGMGPGGFNGAPGAMRPGAGMGLGGGLQPMPGPRSMGVMPPHFAYPFREPPSLLSPTASGTGMSM